MPVSISNNVDTVKKPVSRVLGEYMSRMAYMTDINR